LNSLPAVTREELESKHLAELHELAAEAGIPRYRMLQRGELVKRLSEGGGDDGGERKREERPRRESRPEPREERERPRRTQSEPGPAAEAPPEKPKRKRRRRWGRRRKDVRVHDLLLPGGHGRQAVVYAESRAACTALLREVAAELADATKGADPIALLVDPTPEELAEWRREAPRAELVAAGQARHAEDALAQAKARAKGGEDVVVLIDSLSRFAADFGDAEEAKDLFDAGLAATGGGSLTVVAAVEKSA
jgi:hypothetical protein